MNINNLYINYEDLGNKKSNTIVLMHGWGQNTQMMEMIGAPFISKFRVINIDLPGFGKSEEPKNPYYLDDYANIVTELLKKLKINNPYIVGHSFGGRIAIKIANKIPINRLVLLSSPYRGEDKKKLRTKVLKFLKKVPILNLLEGYAKNKIGSTDYKNATPIMKEVLVNSVNENLLEEAKKIKVPTILIYSDCDTAVPIEEAYNLEKAIEDSGLIIYNGGTHYAYLERLNQTISILDNFFVKEE